MKGDKVVLSTEKIPGKFYNILPDLPKPLPKPKENLEVLGKIFPESLLEQEESRERFIEIPHKVREIYSKVGRPTPLHRARNLEKELDTPASIYYKREDVSFTGSHKTNTAIAQAYYIARDGYNKMTTETGAGQWGSALSLASTYFDLKCKVYMVRCSYEQKPYRKEIMNMYGADVIPSPSDETEAGRRAREKNPDSPGSLGMAISEAIEEAKEDSKTVYSLGSVLNHVLLHQTVIGQEVKKQFEVLGDKPDLLIGCVGGGSNFAGFSYPFMPEVIRGDGIKAIGVEPEEVPTMTEGEYRYDYGDDSGFTPKLKMYTLGHEFVPDPIYAGGLRYHAIAPSLSLLRDTGHVEPESYGEEECFEAARLFTKTEGIVPAPETAHAVKSAIEHAKRARRENEEKVIAFNFSGHGLLDVDAYGKV
ncbi:MAG: TrpB-like pyridoxal phosphate-dependent enzyme [Candidatus Aenigmatarchaeota archaeon]